MACGTCVRRYGVEPVPPALEGRELNTGSASFYYLESYLGSDHVFGLKKVTLILKIHISRHGFHNHKISKMCLL